MRSGFSIQLEDELDQLINLGVKSFDDFFNEDIVLFKNGGLLNAAIKLLGLILLNLENDHISEIISTSDKFNEFSSDFSYWMVKENNDDMMIFLEEFKKSLIFNNADRINAALSKRIAEREVQRAEEVAEFKHWGNKALED